MYDKPRERDWKVYSKSVAVWRDRYLEAKTKEIAAGLADSTHNPTERFWQAQERIAQEAQILVDCLDDHARSKMRLHLMLMLRHGMIRETDLADFTQELRDDVLAVSGE